MVIPLSAPYTFTRLHADATHMSLFLPSFLRFYFYRYAPPDVLPIFIVLMLYLRASLPGVESLV